MQAIIDWLKQRIPTGTDENGADVLRWGNEEGRVCEASVEYVADKFGPQIEQAEQSGDDVVSLVVVSGFDEGWHDIWRRWRELGYV